VRDETRILALLREQAAELSADLKKRDMRASNGRREDQAQRLHRQRPANDARRCRPATRKRSWRPSEWCWRRSGLQGVPIRLLGTRVASLTIGEERELRLF
jgi:hypothetical protein